MSEREIHQQLATIARDLHDWSVRIQTELVAAQNEIEHALKLLQHPNVAQTSAELMQQLRDSVALCDAQKKADSEFHTRFVGTP